MKEIFKDPVLFFIALSIVVTCTSIGNNITFALVNVLTVLFVFLKDGTMCIKRKPFGLYMSFVAIVLVYSAFDRGALNAESFRTRLFSFISISSVFFISYHLKTLNSRQIKGLLIVTIVSVLFSAIGTTIVSYIDPMAIRFYGFGDVEGSDIELVQRYKSMGMMSYPLAHTMPLVAMALSILFCFSRSKFLKVLSVILLVMVVRILFIMTITTAMLLTVIGVTAIFAGFFSGGKPILSITIVIAMLLVFFTTGIVTMFLDFSNATNTEISAKLSDFFVSVQTGAGEGQMGYREELYRASFRTFLSNPFFGWGSDNGSRTHIGEHSYLLDYLAYYGLFALLLFLSWWKEYKLLKPLIPSNLKSYYYYTFIPFLVMCATKAESVCGVMVYSLLVFVQIVFLYVGNIQTVKHQ